MNPKHKQQNEDAEPFKNLKISDWKVLEDIENRSLCCNCNKSRKYFCYSCYIPVTALQGLIPRVKLPVKIDIIKHAREIDGKSTAAHVAVLAPDDVRVYTYPSIPNYEDTEKVVLVYPGKCATSVKSLVEHFRGFPVGEQEGVTSPLQQVTRVCPGHQCTRVEGCLHRQHVEPEPRHIQGSPPPSAAVRGAGLARVAVLAAPEGQPTLVPGHGGGRAPVLHGAVRGGVRRPAVLLLLHVRQDTLPVPPRRPPCLQAAAQVGRPSAPAPVRDTAVSVVTRENI